jgi:hypothetical protein
MDIHNPLTLLRQLKGAPLSILFALTFVNQPVQAKWISSITGYSPNTISSALVLLLEMTLVSCNRSRSAWQLTGAAKQLPLAMALEAPDRKNCDPQPLSTPPPPPPPIEGRIGLQKEEEIPDRENCDPQLSQLSELRAILYDYGIGEPMLTTLLKMDHISLDYLVAHVTKARLEELPANHLIQRLRSNDAKPSTNDQGHAVGCKCDDCDYYKIIICDDCGDHHYAFQRCECDYGN